MSTLATNLDYERPDCFIRSETVTWAKQTRLPSMYGVPSWENEGIIHLENSADESTGMWEVAHTPSPRNWLLPIFLSPGLERKAVSLKGSRVLSPIISCFQKFVNSNSKQGGEGSLTLSVLWTYVRKGKTTYEYIRWEYSFLKLSYYYACQ